MSREKITTSGDNATVRLPAEVLESLGLAVGDEVEILVVDRTLVVRPLNETERRERMEAVTNEVFERRRVAYEELAKGVE